jgi:PAS domain S-box-containing protein
VRLRLGQGLAGWVALNRKPVVVPDVAKDSRWHYLDEIDREVRAAISVPLSHGEKTFGVLSVAHSEVGYFDNPVYLRLLTAISNQVAVTIEKAFLYKQLKESEERFRNVSANTGDWVWEVDAEGRYTYSSAVVTQILGYTPQEVLGKHFYDFFIPEDREKLKSEDFKTSQMRKPFTAFINRNLHKDGHIVILETSGTPVITPDGQFKGYRGVDHDITARLQAEQALASSEHKYRILVEHANDWIWTLDLKGNFTFLNRAAEEASGYRCEEWVGRSFVPIILPEDLPDVNKVYSEILAGNSKSYEVRVLNKDGKLFTLAVNTAPLYEGSRIVGTVSMGHDVTMQKQLEDQLRQAQKMEAIGTLAGGIAHDFNNILGGILGYASLIKTEIPENNPLRTELDTVISLVHRAGELTRQLLGFARGGRYQIEPINLNDIIDEVLELLSRTIDKLICIKPVLNPALAAIEGDAGQIQQVIMNLCLNARDAMPEGGELLIETENIDIDEDSAGGLLGLEAGSYVLLSVSDTGSGMDSETKEHIFEPFFTTKAGKGMNKHSGLGLSMVYGIVHSHGGIIKIYSEVGEGTVFKVYLPATERKVIKKESEDKTPVGGKETILVVDDEELILKPAERILKRAGYKVLTADGGSKALKLFSNYHKEIDLVILDMIMPDMNGTATYNGLKEIDQGVKVILSSGYSRNGQAQELLNSGVKDFLQKPYEFADMLIRVRQVLDGE